MPRLALAALAALLAAPEVRDARLYLAFGAAYMAIDDPGGPDDRLLGAASPAARTVELHGSEEVNDAVRMTPVEGGLTLPEGGAVELAPGGVHVLLMGLDGPLASGDAVPLTLLFESGPLELSLPVEVEGQEAASGHEHGH